LSFEQLLSETCTITQRTAGARDDYNNPVLVDGASTDEPCLLQLFNTGENVYGQDRTLTNYTLFLLPSAEINAYSKVTIDGVDYEVDGDPAMHPTPAGNHHIEAKVRRIAG
jgi:hypothetical protein